MKIRKIILEEGEQIEIALAQDGVPEMFLPSILVRHITSTFIDLVTADKSEVWKLNPLQTAAELDSFDPLCTTDTPTKDMLGK
jgi:hypothetical protein